MLSEAISIFLSRILYPKDEKLKRLNIQCHYFVKAKKE